jgi:hypothetical protein
MKPMSESERKAMTRSGDANGHDPSKPSQARRAKGGAPSLGAVLVALFAFLCLTLAAPLAQAQPCHPANAMGAPVAAISAAPAPHDADTPPALRSDTDQAQTRPLSNRLDQFALTTPNDVRSAHERLCCGTSSSCCGRLAASSDASSPAVAEIEASRRLVPCANLWRDGRSAAPPTPPPDA